MSVLCLQRRLSHRPELTSRCNVGDFANEAFGEALRQESLDGIAVNEFTTCPRIPRPGAFECPVQPFEHLRRLVELPGVDIAFARNELVQSGVPKIRRDALAPQSIPYSFRDEAAVAAVILKCKVVTILSNVT